MDKEDDSLHRLLAHKERQIEAILAIDRIRDSITDVKGLLASIANIVTSHLEADLCLVGLVDETNGKMSLKAVNDRSRVFQQLKRSLVQEALERGVNLPRVSVVESDPVWREVGLNYLLAAPLAIGKERLGTLLILNRERAFDQADVELLEVIASQIDSAIVQARTFSQLQHRNRELELIYKIDRIRDNTTDSQELLSAIVNAVATALDADLCLMGLVDESSGILELKALDDRLGVFGQLDQEAIRNTVEESIALQQISLLESTPPLRARGLKQLLAAPLTISGERLGLLLLWGGRKSFTQSDVKLVQAAVSQTDSAVIHARTRRHLQQRNKELETIYKVDRIRDSGLEFHDMLNAVLAELCQAIEAEMGFIMLFDKSGQQLELKASTAEDIFAVTENYGLIEEMANEALKRARMINRSGLSDKIRSILCVPLILHKEIIGIFGAVNGPRTIGFDQEDERLLAAIASQVDTAIFEDQRTRKIRSTFSRYVSPQVVEMMLAQMEEDYLKGKRATLTVLFSDMRGFTSISERTHPEVLVDVMNQHLEAMTDIILDHGGTLDKYVGDEVMAIFGAPLTVEDHALQAVRTALKMQHAHQKLMARWTEAGREATPIGIGINSGDMIVGNIGCEKRMDYTVIGDNVNLASRLCGLAKGNQVLISEATYQLIRHAVEANELPHVHVKGKAEPVKIYEVVDLKPEI